jgi:hypothetical protein
VQFEELRFVCMEAAIDLVRSKGRPLPVTVVLPGSSKTQLVELPDFPAEDEARHELMLRFAADQVIPNNVPCWGFVSEAQIDGVDVAMVAFGARRHAPHVTASRFADDGQLEEFVPSEELDPTALPFLHPLQHAVDSAEAEPLDQQSGGLPMFGQG